jgi:hypothetical protein
MSCLYHVMQKGHSFINANTYHAEWLEASSATLCLRQDRSYARQTLSVFALAENSL